MLIAIGGLVLLSLEVVAGWWLHRAQQWCRACGCLLVCRGCDRRLSYAGDGGRR